MTNEERLNINLTFIIKLHEVMSRIITEEVDNPVLKFVLKKEFKGLFAQSKKVDREFRKFIREMKKYDDPEELFDTGCDHFYDLIKATHGLDTEEKYVKAIALINNLSTSKN